MRGSKWHRCGFRACGFFLFFSHTGPRARKPQQCYLDALVRARCSLVGNGICIMPSRRQHELLHLLQIYRMRGQALSASKASLASSAGHAQRGSPARTIFWVTPPPLTPKPADVSIFWRLRLGGIFQPSTTSCPRSRLMPFCALLGAVLAGRSGPIPPFLHRLKNCTLNLESNTNPEARNPKPETLNPKP